MTDLNAILTKLRDGLAADATVAIPNVYSFGWDNSEAVVVSVYPNIVITPTEAARENFALTPGWHHRSATVNVVIARDGLDDASVATAIRDDEVRVARWLWANRHLGTGALGGNLLINSDLGGASYERVSLDERGWIATATLPWMVEWLERVATDSLVPITTTTVGVTATTAGATEVVP